MANHMLANKRSEALLQGLGFEREGVAKSYILINGKWEDHVLNSLINPDQRW
jgi:ribosomal-protein-alanine N-acetyltransferase